MARKVDAIAGDLADAVPVDWDGEARASTADLLRELRIVAAVGANRRPFAAPQMAGSWVGHVLDGAVALALTRVAIGVLAAFGPGSPPFVVGPAGVTVGLFTTTALWLLLFGRRDERSRALGALYALIATAFVAPFLQRAQPPVLLLAHGAKLLPVDAFIALALWRFAWVFPKEPTRPRARRIGSAGLWTAAILGASLLLANAVLGWMMPSAQPAWLLALQRARVDSWYWVLVLGTAVPALPFLAWNASSGTVPERNRTVLLVASIVVGGLPMLLAGLLTPIIPALGRPPMFALVGTVAFAALALIVPATAYAVVVQRVIDVRVVVRGALQHALARHCVWVISVGPLVACAIRVYTFRHATVADVVVDNVGLLSLSGLGFLVLASRERVLRLIDRWFSRESVDYSSVLARFEREMRGRQHIRDVHAILRTTVLDALDPLTVTVLVRDEDGGHFLSLDGAVEPLHADSTLADLFRTQSAHVSLRAGATSLADLLPADDLRWVEDAGVEWFFPLLDSTGAAFGAVCVGPARDAGSYSKAERALVTVLASQASARLELLSLRARPARIGSDMGDAVSPSLDWQNEPAQQCRACGRVSRSDVRTCACGHQVEPASVPLVLNGKFRVERLLGAGGMGVVYLAEDLQLKRPVAIKTMPTVTPAHISRLEREARAMASVPHPSLALIYGAERWRQIPLLVVEYLEAGTLADRLRRGPLAVEEVVDLGIVLADALDRMHAGGLLHRDIKPSNIGYQTDGTPKLLDFGLAAILDRVSTPDGTAVTAGVDREGLLAGFGDWPGTATLSVSSHIVGTPLYLSPEAIGGAEAAPSFDLWSLSLVLYEALAGQHPLSGYPTLEAMRRVRSVRVPDVRDFRPECPPALANLLNDALSLAPERRPQTAASLRMQLQSLWSSPTPAAHWLPRQLY